MTLRRWLIGGLVVALAAGCGGEEPTLTGYSETLNALAADLAADLDVLDERMDVDDATVEDAREVITEGVALREQFNDEIDDVVPPALLEDFHNEFLEAHGRVIEAQAAWGIAATSAEGLDHLAASPEAQEFRLEIAEVVGLCVELQARLDDAAERQEIAGTPWLPTEMKDVVELLLDC